LEGNPECQWSGCGAGRCREEEGSGDGNFCAVRARSILTDLFLGNRSSFSLANRKHHCRLCGRIICALPPTSADFLAQAQSSGAPRNLEDGISSPISLSDKSLVNPSTGLPIGMRRAKCSLLLVADWKTGRGQEVEEGFVGWLKIDEETPRTEESKPKPSLKGRRSTGGLDDNSPREVMIKGVRVCRDCWQTVS
jgi:rabenosyn-5